MSRMNLEGPTAVITGAASGIGRALAQTLAGRRCHLALADVNADGLEETARMVRSNAVRVSTHVIDLADHDAIAALPDAVAARHGGADILINNAGVAIGGTFDRVAARDFDWLMEINFFAVVRLTRAFLPQLSASEDARLVFLSSVFGLIAPPGQTAYCASKFAVRGFANSLRHELKASGSKIGVTVVHPGGVATNIAESARQAEGTTAEEREQALERARRFLKKPPERAAGIIVDAIERRAERVLVGGDARFMALMERLAPVSYWKILQPLMARRS